MSEPEKCEDCGTTLDEQLLCPECDDGVDYDDAAYRQERYEDDEEFEED